MKTLEQKMQIMQEDADYRIYEEPKTKPSINWEHVHKDYKYMATDITGETWLYKEHPTFNEYCNEYCKEWTCAYNAIGAHNDICAYAGAYASFVKGTCKADESLVERPEGV